MSVIDTKLRAQRQTLDRARLAIDRTHHLILLEVYGVVRQPLQRVLTLTFPRSVRDRRQRAVGTVRIPIGHHKSRCRDGRNERIGTLVGLLNVLVVEHHVCTDFQPLSRTTIEIRTTRIAVEQRACRRTLLAVITARKVVVCLLVGTRHRELVALQHRRRVIDLVQPIHIDLRQQIIVLSRCHTDLLLILDSLRGVHQVPITARHLRNAQLRAELDHRTIVHLTALGGDHDHSIRRTRAIDRGR